MFGAVSVFAGNIFVSENGIQSDNYYSSDGEVGLTQNVTYIGSDGQNYTLVIKNGLIVSTNQTQQSSGFPSNGLISYWKLDESSGNNTINSINSSLNGTHLNSPSVINGIIDNARNYSGTSQQLTNITNWIDYNFTTTGNFTYGGWTRNYNMTGYAMNFMMGMQIPGQVSGFNIGFNQSGYALCEFGSLNGWQDVYSKGPIPLASWINIYCTSDVSSSNHSIWINGTLNNTASSSGSPKTSSWPLALGGFGWNSGQYPSDKVWYNGTVDEVGIWNRSLNQTEIGQLYNSGDGLTYS